MLLSIVLPTYNVEDYLSRCLKSILDQEVESSQYEVIIVNDGSLDRSGKIAERFSKLYGNVHLINQENRGLSGARNTGLREAKGKFVWFIDSDDCITEGSLKYILACLISPIESLIVNFQRCTEDGKYSNSSMVNHQFEENRVYKGVEYFANRPGDFLCSWRYITKRKLLLEHNLFWKEGIVHEDNEHTPRLLYFIEKLQILHSAVYIYQIRSGSIMTSFSPKKAKSWIEIFKSLRDFRNSLPITDAYRRLLNEYLLQQYSNFLHDSSIYPNSDAEVKSLKRIGFLENWKGMNMKEFGKYFWLKNFPLLFSKFSFYYNRLI
ncbi:glycosyltransferase [Litoribacter populi]|uniref:glycosyltransferase n=1 Tax=Litoribacter populi TaxID=2598460 RepID=UPI00117C2EC3|nr:glycosyltransferase [Litoribacter populi]